MTAGLLRALGSRRAVIIAIAAIMVVAAPSIAIGFLTDDHVFRGELHSTSTHAPAVYDLYRFVPGDAADNQLRIRFGHLPWWAAPDLRVHFLRPLTSLTYAADDRMFGDAPLGYHLISLAWYLAMLVAAAVAFRRWLPPAAATLALAVFGLSAAHVDAYAWISARHIAVAGAFATAALAMRGARSGRLRWLAVGLLMVAFASSEAALAIVPLWLALELGHPTRSWRRRCLASLPVSGMALGYLAIYAVLGGGTRGSGGYHDPLTDPLEFARLAVLRVPLLLGDAALGIPAELAHVITEARLALVGLAAVGVIALAWWLTAPRAALASSTDAQTGKVPTSPADAVTGKTPTASTDAAVWIRMAASTDASSGAAQAPPVEITRFVGGAPTQADARTTPRDALAAAASAGWPSAQPRLLGWLVIGGIAATLPGVAGFPTGRVLVIPDLAFAAVLGALLYRGHHARWPGRILVAVLAVIHLGLAPLAVLRAVIRFEHRARATEAIASRIAQLTPASGRVFMVAASDPMVFLYPRGILLDVAPHTLRCWSQWSAARAGHRISRTGTNTLVIEPIERTLLDDSFDRLYRAADRPFAVGDTVEQCGATIRVAAVRDGRPARLEVELHRSLDDPAVVLLIWRDRKLERLTPPGIGETIEVPWSPGPSRVL